MIICCHYFAWQYEEFRWGHLEGERGSVEEARSDPPSFLLSLGKVAGKATLTARQAGRQAGYLLLRETGK
jgi:hypothetical protein